MIRKVVAILFVASGVILTGCGSGDLSSKDEAKVKDLMSKPPSIPGQPPKGAGKGAAAAPSATGTAPGAAANNTP